MGAEPFALSALAAAARHLGELSLDEELFWVRSVAGRTSAALGDGDGVLQGLPDLVVKRKPSAAHHHLHHRKTGCDAEPVNDSSARRVA